jgi:hypothetical protein
MASDRNSGTDWVNERLLRFQSNPRNGNETFNPGPPLYCGQVRKIMANLSRPALFLGNTAMETKRGTTATPATLRDNAMDAPADTEHLAMQSRPIVKSSSAFVTGDSLL